MRIQDEIRSAARYFKRRAEERGVEPTSSLYSVIEADGAGWRVVITEQWEIKYHLQPGEQAIRVPTILIAEPIEFDDFARTITLAERYATIQLSGPNACGGCRMCCITPLIEEEKLHKSAHAPCSNLDSCTGGCRIYPARPKTCREFECEWLKSQRRNDKMPLQLRPDKCGVMFTAATAPNGYAWDLLEAHPDIRWPTDPFEGERVKEYIKDVTKFGLRVLRVDRYVSEDKG